MARRGRRETKTLRIEFTPCLMSAFSSAIYTLYTVFFSSVAAKLTRTCFFWNEATASEQAVALSAAVLFTAADAQPLDLAVGVPE